MYLDVTSRRKWVGEPNYPNFPKFCKRDDLKSRLGTQQKGNMWQKKFPFLNISFIWLMYTSVNLSPDYVGGKMDMEKILANK